MKNSSSIETFRLESRILHFASCYHLFLANWESKTVAMGVRCPRTTPMPTGCYLLILLGTSRYRRRSSSTAMLSSSSSSSDATTAPSHSNNAAAALPLSGGGPASRWPGAATRAARRYLDAVCGGSRRARRRAAGGSKFRRACVKGQTLLLDCWFVQLCYVERLGWAKVNWAANLNDPPPAQDNLFSIVFFLRPSGA
ncbi:unnamed protein product [Urochloa humidicola]